MLLAYAKLTLYEDLLESAVPDDPYLARELGRYFPKAIAARFPDALEHHRLRREIIATQLANSMINRGGPSLIVRIADQTGAAPAAIASAFAAVRDSYGMTALNGAIDGLDNRISGKLQLDLYAAVQDLLLDRIIWFLRNVDLAKGLADVVAHYRDGIAAVAAALDNALSEDALHARARRAGRSSRTPACLTNSPSASPICALAGRGARHRPGRRPHRQAGRRSRGDLFRRRRLLPARSHRQRRRQHSDRGLFRPAGARSGAGFDRRRRAAACRRHGRQRRGRPGAVEAWVAPRKTRSSASAARSTRSPIRG